MWLIQFCRVGADSTSLSAQKARLKDGDGDGKPITNGTSNGIERNPSETRREYKLYFKINYNRTN